MARGLTAGIAHGNPEWPDEARAQLCLMAPWLLVGPGLAYARGNRGNAAVAVRLFSFRYQGSRRPSIVLVPRRQPRLELQWVKSHALLPRNLWQRPTVPGGWLPCP